MTNTVLRQEKKFLITLDQFYTYSHYFDQLLHGDPHNGADGYAVRSLYFDTPDERDFYEKEDGLEVRRKIRLRVYNPHRDMATLEMKQKQGDNQKKRSLALKRRDAERLIKGDYSPLLYSSDPFAAECFGVMNMLCYRPKTVVEYQRKAYIAKENSTRLTFDHHIKSSESCFDIFSDSLAQYPVMDPYNVVFEVKYKGFLLSYIKDIINVCDKTTTSVSKYCLARSVGLHYLF